MTLIASNVDSDTERIVSYLNSYYNVPINVMVFRYFTDGGHQYLARTWLMDEEAPVPVAKGKKSTSSTVDWNGRDWYVSYGVDNRSRYWEDAKRYGFVSAGGGEWYSKTIKNLPEGARVFVHIPQNGYVAVGTVTGPPATADEASLYVDGVNRPFRSLELNGVYSHPDAPEGADAAEYVVPVEWIATVDRDQAYWQLGMFANQHSACKLRNQFTIDELSRIFDLND
ncbi:hypothetical protein [Arthrobacter castelli]|uniref:hypothetical protein n=1 Tax=Arthrobacter castelli TaxID=271431 RepID=UPI0012DEA270|nr:hypothetical protein [Arthrobacter castelli]